MSILRERAQSETERVRRKNEEEPRCRTERKEIDPDKPLVPLLSTRFLSGSSSTENSKNSLQISLFSL